MKQLQTESDQSNLGTCMPEGGVDNGVPAGKLAGISLKTRIMLILLAVALIHTALDYGIQKFVLLPGFINLERKEACSDMHRCLQAIDSEVRHLETLCVDWATWDDTYKFVADRNAEYITSNLKPSTFVEDKLNVLYICDTAGRVVWGQARGIKPDETEIIDIREFPVAALPSDHPLLSAESNEGVSGVYLTQRGPMLIAARPIVTSESRGPSRGTLIMGRLLDQRFIEALCRQTRVAFKLTPIPEGSFDEDVPEIPASREPSASCCTIRARSEDVLRGYSVLWDIQDKPVLLMQADISREILSVGRNSAWLATTSTMATAIVLTLALLVLLQKTVLKPVTELTAHVTAIGGSENLTSRLGSRRSDEIGMLGREFDRMVGRLHGLLEYRQKLLDTAVTGIFTVDTEQRITTINAAFGEITGLSGQDVIGEKCSVLEGTPCREKCGLFDPGRQVPIRKKQCIFHTKDGRELAILKSAELLRDEDGNVTGGVESFVDVTALVDARTAAEEQTHRLAKSNMQLEKEIADRKRVETRLLEYQKRLQALASELVMAEDRERQRIAAGLHDNVTQNLVGSRIKLSLLRKLDTTSSQRAIIDEVLEVILSTEEDTRLLTFELCPPMLHELGIVAAIDWLVEEFQEHNDTDCEFSDDGLPKPLKDEVRGLLFATVRELLRNVSRHSNARHVGVAVIRQGHEVRVTVEDDGVGFDASGTVRLDAKSGGFGLFGVGERLRYLGGRLRVDSEPGEGTRITAIVPIGV
jgi:PAS domain S-box-containing protein